MGRPKKKNEQTGKDLYDPYELINIIMKYIDDAKPYPTITQFLSKNKLSKSRFYEIAAENTELREAVEILHAKTESIIEYGAASGQIPIAFAIFKLKQKQHGWTDKPELEINTTPIINIQMPKIAEEE